MNNSIEKALIGKRYLKASDTPIEGYFECIKAIKPLLANFDSSSSTPGFYINISENKSNQLNIVRLTFFTYASEETEKIIEIFLKNNSNIISLPVEDFDDKNFKEPIECKISEGYGGEEIRFRNFLNTYTHIGLDLLDYDILYSRRLVAEYRLTYSPQRISCKPLFEPPFIKHSKFFNQLDDYSVEQLWNDLNFWHSKGDWTHFLVNMLLPGDWIFASENFQRFFLNPTPKQPIIGETRLRMLRMFGLEDFKV
ncbi:hypothetical protein KJA15_02415 [Patescibacteria group bacterium]|nr:hypothetical protein [Patescibacteria group bacterium]